MLQCHDIDALMMDWLYGELDPEAARQVETHVEGCSRCEAELAAFERTRDLFRQVPAEEPPSAITAMLMREAASRAAPATDSKQRGGGGIGGWLSGLFAPLMHPAAAALATLVLVAGVAGTLYLRRGDDQFARTEVDTSDSRDIATASPPPSPKADPAPETKPEVAAALADSEAAQEGGTGAGSTVAGSGLKFDGRSDRTADLLNRERDKALRDESKLDLKKATIEPRLAKKNKRRHKSKPNVVATNAVSGGDVSPNQEGFVGGAKQAQQGTTAYGAYRDDPSAGLDAWARDKQTELTAAYKKENCLRAAKIANDIRDRNPRFYKRETSELEAVKRCRPYVEKERSRRRVARSKAAGGGAKASKAAEKARAAPDDAFDEPAESK